MNERQACQVLKEGAWWASLDCCISKKAKDDLTTAIALAVSALRAGKNSQKAMKATSKTIACDCLTSMVGKLEES